MSKQKLSFLKFQQHLWIENVNHNKYLSQRSAGYRQDHADRQERWIVAIVLKVLLLRCAWCCSKCCSDFVALIAFAGVAVDDATAASKWCCYGYQWCELCSYGCCCTIGAVVDMAALCSAFAGCECCCPGTVAACAVSFIW